MQEEDGEVLVWSSVKRMQMKDAQYISVSCQIASASTKMSSCHQAASTEECKQACELLFSNHLGAVKNHCRVSGEKPGANSDLFTASWDLMKHERCFLPEIKKILFQMGIRKLHVQASGLVLAARKTLEQIMKLLAHNEEVSCIPWVLFRTNGFQNILIFLLWQYNPVLWSKEKQWISYNLTLIKLLIFSNYIFIIRETPLEETFNWWLQNWLESHARKLFLIKTRLCKMGFSKGLSWVYCP